MCTLANRPFSNQDITQTTTAVRPQKGDARNQIQETPCAESMAALLIVWGMADPSVLKVMLSMQISRLYTSGGTAVPLQLV